MVKQLGTIDEYTDFEISLLVNAIYFFLDYAFIIEKDGTYRLIVITRNTLCCDKIYETERGAKIGFFRAYNKRRIKETSAEWSLKYSPLKEWVKGKISIANMGFAQTDSTAK